MDDISKARLAERIRYAPIRPTECKFLLQRLSVASHEGTAHVIRDFEALLEIERAKIKNGGRFIQRGNSPCNKMAAFYQAK